MSLPAGSPIPTDTPSPPDTATGRVDTVIVGAGLAGLWAGQLLARAGREVVVVEAADAVGGRVRSDRVDGFTLDRGFQLLNPAYPEGQVAWPAIRLRQFEPGVELVIGSSHRVLADPRRSPTRVGASITAARELGITKGLAALAGYSAVATAMSAGRAANRADIPIGTALSAAGVDDRTLDLLVRPFLSGVFADAELGTSRRFADAILASMLRATPGVPPDGMAELPRLLAAGLDVRLSTPALSVSATQVVTDAGTLRADAVIVATGDPHALLPTAPATTWRALTTWYFTADLPNRHRMLLLPPEGPLANVAVISDIAPEYAPLGRRLVAANAVGHHDDTDSERAARTQAARMLDVSPGDLELVAHYPIADALPDASAPLPARRPLLVDGVLLAGDHRSGPSIQGALASGRAAAAVLGVG